LSGTYRAQGGETWSTVARETTGNDLDAAKIARANPGVLSPLPPGVVVQIPIETSDTVVAEAADLSVKVNGVELGLLTDFNFVWMADAVAKAGFVLPNELETRALFPPLGSPVVTIDLDGARIFTGRAASPVTFAGVGERILDISCYSTPGILEIATPPLVAFPLEFLRSNLIVIAGDLCRLHGVSPVFEADAGPVFERVDIKPGNPVLGFIADLGSQRGLVLTSSEIGELVFWRGETAGPPMGRYEKGKAPVINFTPQINEDRYYSSVTGMVPLKTKKPRRTGPPPIQSYTVQNPHATDLVRPYTFEIRDISPGELPTAVDSAAGRMFAGVFTASLELSTWKNLNGEMFVPGRKVQVKSPDDYVDDFYDFLIAGVALQKQADKETAILSLALPGAFSGEIPTRLPWH